ncbi:UNVERIFIED_CONTAM: 24-methylenesterol C-methyltransferase 2 [Sesamum latifolium]|uniref:Methyltransferase n=1 Tax=Sesamum latifolium TaxID=2727402 RepID=A0AAW2XMU4_9LAMI
MAVDLLNVKPGARILDAGCGVGGPMRAIAAHSGANVVGVTINEYQVNRARMHNKKAGLDKLCEVVCGNFLQMPFEDNTFDGAYSIEATCHAPKLEDVYSEIYRVLKPGSLYVSYEWLQGYSRGGRKGRLRSDKGEGFGETPVKPVVDPAEDGSDRLLEEPHFGYSASVAGDCTKGVVDVHEMLFVTADYLTRGGETGIFTPMHMILCRKPESKLASSSA